jgi:hypothetical protein
MSRREIGELCTPGVATLISRAAQLEPTLYADQSVAQPIGAKLLLSICGRQVAKMLDDRRLAALEIRQTSLDLSRRPLNVADVGADGEKLSQH